MTFHVIRPRRYTKILGEWKFFSSTCGNSRFKLGSVIVHNISAYFTLSLSATQVYMIKERCWFSQIDFFVEYFPHWINQCFVITPFHGVRISIPNWEPSPNRVLIRFSQIVFPIIVLPKDDHEDFAQEERLGLPYWTMSWAICVVVDQSKCLDTPIWEFSVILEHLPFLSGYKQILRPLLVLRNPAI